MILKTDSLVENQYKLLNTIRPSTHKLLWDNKLQLATTHGNPTVSGRKFQVAFCLLLKKNPEKTTHIYLLWELLIQTILLDNYYGPGDILEASE